MKLGRERRTALTSLMHLLQRGITNEGDADELIALLQRGLEISGVILADDWSYEGWLRLDDIPSTWAATYAPLHDQDPSRAALLAAAPGTLWVLERDSDDAGRQTELYDAFVAHRFVDTAVFRLPNAVRGNIVGGFYRHRGMPRFDDDDALLISMLLPNLGMALAARRGLAMVRDQASADRHGPAARSAAVTISYPSGAITWTRRARQAWENVLGVIGPVGWQRIERALRSAVRIADATSEGTSQYLIGGLRVELANVPPRRAERRRVLATFVIDGGDHDLVTEQARTPAEELLSARQLQIARLARGGLTAPEIGDRLGIGETTVRHHLRLIYRRLGVRTRVELAALIAAASPSNPR